ncbi:MAG: YkgJ family cysteine cluster protein [Verrucomicrobiota bacterium]
MKRRSPQSMMDPALLEEVRAVYRDLAARPIERSCERRTECCHFKITGETPYLTKGEALVAAKAWKASGRSKLPEKKEGSCPFLEDQSGKCYIYEGRPFGCRSHFCKAAGGPYARREVIDLIRRLETVDRALHGEGPLPLPSAIQKVL